MEDLLESIYQGILFTPVLEWVAVFTSVLYVIFIARQRMVGWLFALITSSLYVYLCFRGQLYIESILQLFYMLMAIYGWYQWTIQNQTKEEVHIRMWKARSHLIFVLLGGALTAGLGYLFESITDQQNAYLDAFTTVFSFGATFMVTQRVLENWLYWIVIDSFSVYLYYSRGLQLSALLFVFFTVLAIVGFFQWYRAFKVVKKV